jgi:cytoskeleton protein RodZ
MDSEEAQHTAVGEPAGKQLRRAREKLGLSLKDVANAQHLRVSIIQSIEDAEYDQIDSELFLKGYVRAYAKQVGADADELIQTLNVELEPIRREREQLEQENPLVDI